MGKIRKTKSLCAIIDAFDQANSALSVVELIEQFKGDMNKTTVYRILERLEKESVLHSYTGTSGLRWYAKSKRDTNSELPDQHSHFECRRCGKSKCLHVDIPIPSVPNYRIDAANLILVGQCEECIT